MSLILPWLFLDLSKIQKQWDKQSRMSNLMISENYWVKLSFDIANANGLEEIGLYCSMFWVLSLLNPFLIWNDLQLQSCYALEMVKIDFCPGKLSLWPLILCATLWIHRIVWWFVYPRIRECFTIFEVWFTHETRTFYAWRQWHMESYYLLA